MVAITTMVMQTVFASYYNRRNASYKAITPLYNLLQLSTLTVLWGVMFITDLSFNPSVLLYSLVFGIGFTGANFGLVNAIRTGPISLTSLFMQFSLIGTTIWGFFAWDDPITLLVIIGLVLVAISLALCLYKGKEENERKISKTWLFYVLIAFSGNMTCTVAQKQQQMDFNGAHRGQMMFTAIALSLIIFIVVYLRSDRSDTRVLLKKAGFWPVMSGACNMIANFCVMLLATSPLNPSLIYPSLAVVCLSINMLFSLLAFKEKLKWWQWVGIGVGAVATVLLSI
jgi:drug/metabolite transporter (DMT)-like permease